YADAIPSTYKYKNNPDEPIINILERLARNDIEIDAIIVNKERIDANLKTLPYGVLYNYFSKNVLIRRITMYEDAKLFIDRTNKQTHKMKHFDDYIYTEALLNKGRNFNFSIEHADSNVVTGICAVDFISWGLSRFYEFGDDRFISCFQDKLRNHIRYLFPQ
ncbi:MAG: hypothetical protein A2Z02_01550, partial [Chloroflexi bacterium RBG_16_48_7]